MSKPSKKAMFERLHNAKVVLIAKDPICLDEDVIGYFHTLPGVIQFKEANPNADVQFVQKDNIYEIVVDGTVLNQYFMTPKRNRRTEGTVNVRSGDFTFRSVVDGETRRLHCDKTSFTVVDEHTIESDNSIIQMVN